MFSVLSNLTVISDQSNSSDEFKPVILDFEYKLDSCLLPTIYFSRNKMKLPSKSSDHKILCFI
jgi:hypothetical protein